ncbi:hypothetical protein BgiMline_032912 [Biomphalaria glabrata]|nr:hypothetical protein BgiMline_015913 [Biomphalaria glabrata]
MYVRSTIWSKRMVSNSAKQETNETGLLSNDQYGQFSHVHGCLLSGTSWAEVSVSLISRDEQCAAVHHTRMCRGKD